MTKAVPGSSHILSGRQSLKICKGLLCWAKFYWQETAVHEGHLST